MLHLPLAVAVAVGGPSEEDRRNRDGWEVHRGPEGLEGGSPVPAGVGCQQPLPSSLLPWAGLRTGHNDQLSSLPHRGVGAAGDFWQLY